jgi:hypothetical protein
MKKWVLSGMLLYISSISFSQNMKVFGSMGNFNAGIGRTNYSAVTSYLQQAEVCGRNLRPSDYIFMPGVSLNVIYSRLLLGFSANGAASSKAEDKKVSLYAHSYSILLQMGYIWRCSPSSIRYFYWGGGTGGHGFTIDNQSGSTVFFDKSNPVYAGQNCSYTLNGTVLEAGLSQKYIISDASSVNNPKLIKGLVLGLDGGVQYVANPAWSMKQGPADYHPLFIYFRLSFGACSLISTGNNSD